MKKAQSELIGMILLVLAVVLFAIFNKLSSTQAFIRTGELLSETFKESFVSTSVQTSFYNTVKGIPLDELLGNYVCYGKTESDYGNGTKLYVNATLRNQFDTYHGKGKWALAVDKSDVSEGFYMDSNDFKPEFSLPDKSNYISYQFFFPLPCLPGKQSDGFMFVFN